MILCPQCAHRCSDAVRDCPACGAPLPRICPSCHAVNDVLAAFCSRCGSRVDDAVLADAQQRTEQSTGYLPKDLADRFLAADTEQAGDRRQVTILFVDLVRSTEIVRELGGENMADLLDEFLDGIASVVTGLGGTVAELAGDGALCLFGAPTVHEDDPERALRAALSIQRATANLRLPGDEPGWQLQVRVGVHTGTVVLRVAGHAHRLGYAPVGNAVHFTHRLQTAASPGEILVSEVTRNLTSSLFRFGAELSPNLKGFDSTQKAFALVGERDSVQRRYLRAGATAFVGRESDVAAVRSCTENLAVGLGGVLTIWGEAGIGKSRLLAEARQQSPRSIGWMAGRGLSYAQDTPYSIFGQQIRRAAGVAEADTEYSARHRLRALLVQTCGAPKAEEIYRFLATALGMRLDDADKLTVERSSGAALQEEIIGSLRALVVATMERTPLALIFEDLHWADRASIAALDNLLPLAEEHSVLFVLVARPDPDGPSWTLRQKIETQYAHCHTSVQLGALSARASSELALALLKATYLPAEVRQLFLQKAEGIPLYVEELIRSLLEQRVLRRAGDTWRLAVAPDELRLPETLQGIILARFDRLQPGSKRILQAAAVLGPMVSYRVLAALTGADGHLPAQLRDLQRLGFLRETSRMPERVFVFRHALIRDAAYQTMRERTRKELHRRAGGAMEQVYSERIGEHRGVIAEHFHRASAWEKANHYLAEAGDESTRLHAHAEARLHYARAAEALAHLPDTAENRRGRIDTVLKRASVSYIAEAPEVNLERLAEGAALANELVSTSGSVLDDQVRLSWIEYWSGRVRYIAGDTSTAMDNYRRALVGARQLGDSRLTLIVSAMLGQAFAMQGHWELAQDHLGEALPVLQKAGDWREWSLASGYLGVAVAAAGEYERGLAMSRSGVERALELRGGNLIASTRALLCATHLICERMHDVERTAEDTVEASERAGEEVVLYIGLGFRGWAESQVGDSAAATATMARSRAVGRGLGQLLLADWFAVAEADVALSTGAVAEAVTLAATAVHAAQRAGGIYSEGMAHRVWARACAAADPPRWKDAEEHLTVALELLDTVDGTLPAAHTHLAWAELCLARDDLAGAYEHLRMAEARFTTFGLDDELRRVQRVLAEAFPERP